MTPQEKRLKTINDKYGSVSEMLKSRDVRDLILGGYNGGKRKAKKGYATWQPEQLSQIAKARDRDSHGRFLPTPAGEADTDTKAPR